MHVPARRIGICSWAIFSLVLLGPLGLGCKSQTTSPGTGQQKKTAAQINAQAPPPPPAPVPQAVSDRLREIASAGKIDSLTRPDFSDYRLHFQHAYDTSSYAPLWLTGNQPTPQATAV